MKRTNRKSNLFEICVEVGVKMDKHVKVVKGGGGGKTVKKSFFYHLQFFKCFL
jgi:hypothetical protein